MKKYLVNFATPQFYASQAWLNQSALKYGIDETISYQSNDLFKTKFYRKNQNILAHKRGAGFYLWKPYLIWQTLKKIKTGDCLVYADSGIEIIDNLQPLFDLSRQNRGVLLFNVSEHKNYAWTKRDCFILMKADKPKYWQGQQVFAAMQVYIKNSFSLKFVQEWLSWCQNENILTDRPNSCGKPNRIGFIDHRHDQSVLSILAVKYKLPLFRDPSQWGNYLKIPFLRKPGEFIEHPYSSKPYQNSLYNTLIYHHRNYGLKIKLIRFLYFLKNDHHRFNAGKE